MFRLLAIGAVVVLAGCATEPSKVEQGNLSRIKNVGVVSVAGDPFHMVTVGLTAFHNRRSEAAVAEWRIDEEAENLVKSTLEKGGQYRVVRLQPDRAALSKAHTGKPMDPLNFEVVGKELRPAIAGQPLDAIIVVARYPGEDAISGSNQRIEGVGLYARAPLTSAVKILAPFASYGIWVVDGATLKPLGSRPAVMPREKGSGALGSKQLPYRIIDVAHYKRDFGSLSEGDKDVIRKTVSEVFAASIPLTLKGLGFAAP